MSKPTIYGFPQSSFVWSTRAIAQHKAIDHTFEALTPGDHKAPAHLERHPYGKVPALVHGDLTLYESPAIARYLDEVSGGASLQGSTPAERAQVEQWMSVVNCYLYNQVVIGYLFPLRAGNLEGQALADQLDKIRHSVALIDASVGSGTWAVGDGPTLADFFLGPLLFLLATLEPSQPLLAEFPNAGRLLGALKETPSFMGAAPPPPA